MWGRCFKVSGVWFLGVGKGKFLHGLGTGEHGRLAGNPDTSPGSARANAPVVRDAVADVYGCGETGPRSLAPS